MKYLRFLLTAIFLVISATVQASNLREVNLIVPYAAGGVTDQMARMVQPELEKRLGVPIVVRNLPGSGNNVAINYVLSRDDHNNFIFTLDDFIIANSNTDIPGKFVATNIVGTVSYVIFGSKNTSISQFKKDIGGSINIANSGLNGGAHVWLEQLRLPNINHVPYKGASQLMVDVQSRIINYGILSMAASAPGVDNGDLVPLVVSTETRHPRYPNVPTFREIGLTGSPGQTWFGVLAKKETPPEILRILSQAIRDSVRSSAPMQNFTTRGMELINLDQKESQRFYEKDMRYHRGLKNGVR